MKMQVSIIIPNYNNDQYLESCVNSIYSQSYKNYEVIVVDDGSADSSLEVLKILSSKYNGLKVICQENAGPSKARNVGVEHAKGEYVAFLDSDDLWKPDKLNRQIALIEQSDGDLVYSRYKWFSDTKEFENEILNPFPQSSLDYWFDTYLSPSTVLIRKSKLIQLGGWNEGLRGCEDMDLWFRASLNNFKILQVDSFDVLIRVHEENSKKNYLKMYENHILSFENWLNLIKKYKYNVDHKQLIESSRKKLNRARYYAFKMNNKKLCFLTFKLGFKYFGLSYFNKLTIIQIYKSIIN